MPTCVGGTPYAEVKHNVLLTPAVLFIHWVLAAAPSPRRAGAFLRLPALPKVFIAMGVLGPIVFVAHWPYLWPDVLARYKWYLSFHLHHEHFPIFYFGELLTHPPFPRSFIYVMTAVTVPLPVLVLFIMGALLAAISGHRQIHDTEASYRDPGPSPALGGQILSPRPMQQQTTHERKHAYTQGIKTLEPA